MARKANSVSIYSIARELGVSPTTVSRAINNRAGVREEIRRKVLQLVQEYDLKINYNLRTSPRILILTDATAITEYTASILAGISQYTSQSELQANIAWYSPKKKGELLNFLREQQCAGCVVLNAHLLKHLEELADAQMPVMLVDERCDSPNVGWIDNDSFQGSYDAVNYLISQGHRNIAFLKAKDSENHRKRFEGYTKAMADAGLKNCAVQLFQPVYTEASVKNKFQEFLKKHPEITAIAAINDNVAMLTIQLITEEGLRVPDDISVIGFDDYYHSQFTTPALTTIRHSCREAGFRAAKAIDDYLKNNGKIPLVREVLPTKLIIRKSCCDIRQK